LYVLYGGIGEVGSGRRGVRKQAWGRVGIGTLHKEGPLKVGGGLFKKKEGSGKVNLEGGKKIEPGGGGSTERHKFRV